MAIRREKLIEMISADPNKRWSVRVMAEEAKKLPWFQENQPRYSKNTASKDYTMIMEDIKEHREELADHYIRTHLSRTDEMIEDLEDQLDALEDEERLLQMLIDSYDDQLSGMKDDWEEIGKIRKDLSSALSQRSKIRKEQRDINTSILQVMRRQSTLVPIQVPFEQKTTGQVDHSYQLTIDDLRRHREALAAPPLQLEQYVEIVDGEYENSSS